MLPKFRRVMATCFCFWRFPCWKRLNFNSDTDSTYSRRTHVAELTELPPGKNKAGAKVGVGLHPIMQDAMINIGATLLVRPGAQINPLTGSTEGAINAEAGAINASTEGAINANSTEINASTEGLINVSDTAQASDKHATAAPRAQKNTPSPSSPEGGGTIYVNNAAAQAGQGGLYSPSSTLEGEIIVNNGAMQAGSGSTSIQSKQNQNVDETVTTENVVHQQNTNQFIPPVQQPPPTSSSTESVHYIIPNSKSFHMYPTCTKMYPSPRSNRPLGPERLL